MKSSPKGISPESGKISRLRFFFDRNMSYRIVEMVRIFEGPRHIVEHHDERFHETTKDVEWLAELGKDEPKPIVISGDAAILRNKAEKAVLREADLTFFCLERGWTQRPFDEQAWMFLKVWPLIVSGANVSPSRQIDVRVGNQPKIEIGLPTRS